MAAFQYSISPQVFSTFPGYVRGVLVFDQLRNDCVKSDIAQLLREAEQQARDGLPGNVAEMPAVVAWRTAYRSFGAKPAEHRSSIEALLWRVVKGDEIPSINTLVDIGNIVSLRHGLPAGMHPLPLGGFDVELRPARDGDVFITSEGHEPEAVPAGEIVFANQTDVLTRRWTWRQSVTTRTLAETTRVFFNIDGLPPTGMDEVRHAMQDAQNLVTKYCGGRLVASVLIDEQATSFRTLVEG